MAPLQPLVSTSHPLSQLPTPQPYPCGRRRLRLETGTVNNRPGDGSPLADVSPVDEPFPPRPLRAAGGTGGEVAHWAPHIAHRNYCFVSLACSYILTNVHTNNVIPMHCRRCLQCCCCERREAAVAVWCLLTPPPFSLPACQCSKQERWVPEPACFIFVTMPSPPFHVLCFEL